jgi:exodeoxyribonuclease V
MEWGSQQIEALREVRAWLATRNAPQIFRLWGFAGVGKTTLAREIAGGISGRVLFCAYTGKAALVLRSKGAMSASTIHGLIYKPEEDDDGKPVFALNPESPMRGAALAIVDECSMVNEELGKDFLSFGTRVLVLGDPAQLPPVKGGGYFTEAEPDFMLTEIHRQALDNPIIAMSMHVREGKPLQLGVFGESKVIRRSELEPGEVMGADQVLCGLNSTRRGLNFRFRDKLGYTNDYPQTGDRLVCLKNDRERQLYNGGLWEVKTADYGDAKRLVNMEVVSLDVGGPRAPVTVNVPIEYFHGSDNGLSYRIKRAYDAFDFGYALTCHKFQGSQANHVLVFDESECFREHTSRWLYTAITRAAEKITVVV